MFWTPSDSSGQCVRHISEDRGAPFSGTPYEDIFCIYPWMERFYMKWELDGYRNNDLHSYFREMQNNSWIPISVCVIYAVSIMAGLNYFKYRKPWDCRKALVMWNFSLSVFSLMGFLRMLPTSVHWLTNYSLEDIYCNEGYSNVGDNPVLLWCLLFAWSKFPELIDTFFIVVHKKQLIFLHWYHHITVLLYAWWVTAKVINPGMFFGTMNFGVHAVMYFYYFLMAAKCKPKWFQPKVITALQITQMVIGVVITGMGVHFSNVPGCWTGKSNATAGLLMYVSYFVLFMKFFLDKYLMSYNNKKSMTRKSPYTSSHNSKQNGIKLNNKHKQNGVKQRMASKSN